MKRLFSIAAITLLVAGSANALIVVDGVPGGDTDGLSPFQTLQAAVNYARATAETEIEIDTNGPLAGADISPGIVQPASLNTLPNHLTIRAGAGFTPVINSLGLRMLPKNTSQLVTLENLKVQMPNGGPIPLQVGCNLTATNCIFAVGGTSPYNPAVTAAIQANDTTATLTMTSCTISGHNGLQAGRACQNYILTRCLIYTDSAIPHYAHAIANNNNFPPGYGGTRLDQTYTSLVPISVGRALTLESCIIQGTVTSADGAQTIGWPAMTLSPSNVTNESNCLGPITATNCVFSGGGGIKYGLAVVGSEAAGTLAPQNGYGLTLTHCTFHMQGVATAQPAEFGGAVRIDEPANSTTNYTHKITNCLFDMPPGTIPYVIGTANFTAHSTLTGNANVYHCPAANEYYNLNEGDNPPPFETSVSYYLGNGDQNYFTDQFGTLQANGVTLVAAKAVAVSPAVTTDKDGNPRPLPSNAAKNDIGADEVDESAPSAVATWTLY